MSDELLLDDLEDFVNGDWKTIYEEHEKEEYRKEINEPVIPAIPTYEEFYKLLVLQIGRPDTPPELEYLIHRIITYQERKSTKSFENVWSMFCNPNEYRVMEDNYICSNCNNKWSIVINRGERIPIFQSPRWNDGHQVVERHQEHVHCPCCGYCFMVTTGKVVGVFSN